MKLLKSPVFLLCCLLFVMHQALRLIWNYQPEILASYLDPFLAMPIMLTLLLWERRYLFKWKGYYRLKLIEVLVATLFVALVAEFIFPIFSSDFTTDLLDVLFFFLGAALFYLTINPKKKNRSGDIKS